MTKLPVLSGKELCKALGKIGYPVDHQPEAISFCDARSHPTDG